MNTFWETILISSLGMIGGFISASLTTYINTKSQYKAMREEIGEITEAVESVKKTFHDDTEKLKSQLSVLTNKHSILFTEEKEALLAYLSAWNIWNSKLEKMIIRFTEEEEMHELVKLQDEIYKENNVAYDKIQICVSKLELFMPDDEIINTVHYLNTETYQVQVLNENYMGYHMDYSFDVDYHVNALHEVELAKDVEVAEEWSNAVEKIEKAKEQRHNEYNRDLMEISEQVYRLKNEFIRLSKEYIRKGIS